MDFTTTQFHSGLRVALCVPLLSMTILGCQVKGKEDKTESVTVKGDTISVSEQSKLIPRLKILTVQEEVHRLQLLSAGTVKAIPTLYAEIAPPFSGRVTAVHLRLGLKTKVGTPLFEMSSPEFTEAQKLYFQAKSEYQNSKLTLKRQQDLRANGVGADREVEEAEMNHAIKQKEYENALASLKIFNVDVNKLVFGQPLVVRAPIAGEVITNEVVMGQYIRAEDPPLAKVAELSKIWVAGMVKEKDLSRIRELEGADIAIAAFPDKKITGKIYHIDEIVDEETRSVQVLIECPNQDHLLKPGMYVSVKFIEKPTESIFIPEKSLLQFNDKSYVLLQTARNKYVKRYVETGATNAGKVQIVSGLKAGEKVIGEGAFFLLDAK